MKLSGKRPAEPRGNLAQDTGKRRRDSPARPPCHRNVERALPELPQEVIERIVTHLPRPIRDDGLLPDAVRLGDLNRVRQVSHAFRTATDFACPKLGALVVRGAVKEFQRSEQRDLSSQMLAVLATAHTLDLPCFPYGADILETDSQLKIGKIFIASPQLRHLVLSNFAGRVRRVPFAVVHAHSLESLSLDGTLAASEEDERHLLARCCSLRNLRLGIYSDVAAMNWEWNSFLALPHKKKLKRLDLDEAYASNVGAVLEFLEGCEVLDWLRLRNSDDLPAHPSVPPVAHLTELRELILGDGWVRSEKSEQLLGSLSALVILELEDLEDCAQVPAFFPRLAELSGLTKLYL